MDGRESVRLQAQVLREMQGTACAGGTSAFHIMCDEKEAGAPQSGRPAAIAGGHREGLKRAIETVQESGLEDYRIELAPDGTISIVVGAAHGNAAHAVDPADFLEP